jgi:hypothetical protein
MGNRFGTGASGQAADPNTLSGVRIGTSTHTIVSGNLISGNGASGLVFDALSSPFVQNSAVTGNVIGLTADETSALGNRGSGVQIEGRATGNTIGGSTAGAGNVIAGNKGDGINVTVNLADASANYVYGNDIGVDRTGQQAFGNGGNGVSVSGNWANMVVGGLRPGRGNLIDSNGKSGVFVAAGASVNVWGNSIGLAADGSTARGNLGQGVFLDGAGKVSIQQNVISGNSLHGVDVFNTGTGADVFDNLIGLDTSGLNAVPNGMDGVIINGSNGVVVEGNVISGNGIRGDWGGVDVGAGSASTNTLVVGNMIGVNVQGNASVGNRN